MISECWLPCCFLFLLILAVILGIVIFQTVFNVKVEDLTGKHIVVTGGSSGIGKSVASIAARRGANVTIIARDENKLNSVLKELQESAVNPTSQKLTALSMDVSQPYELTENKLTELEDNVGPVYMLVNCAGAAVCATVENDSEANFRHMLNLNLMGTVLPTKAMAKKMSRRGEGVIVITSSLASILGIFGMGAYCSSKWALRGFAETLYYEMNPLNVSVTLCLPPDTDTPGLQAENIGKPEETKLISANAGIYPPEKIAEKLLSDALKKRFWSTVGLDNVIMAAGCGGLSPPSDVYEIILQITTASLFRILAIFDLSKFKRTVNRLHQERKLKQSEKKAE